MMRKSLLMHHAQVHPYIAKIEEEEGESGDQSGDATTSARSQSYIKDAAPVPTRAHVQGDTKKQKLSQDVALQAYRARGAARAAQGPSVQSETPAAVEAACFRGCMSWLWQQRPIKIICLVLIPLALYGGDVIPDILLAVQYYQANQLQYFGLTLGFVLGPSVIVQVVSMIVLSQETDVLTAGRAVLYVLHLFQLGVVINYVALFLRVWRRMKVTHKRHVAKGLAVLHLFEAALESVPQLCLQLFIVLQGGAASAVQILSMAVSLLASIKSVLVAFHVFTPKEENLRFGMIAVRFTIILFWKVLEVCARVLVIGLFASAFGSWCLLPLGAQWVVMVTVTLWSEPSARDCMGFLLAVLSAAVDTFSVTFSMDHNRTFWTNSFLTLAGNVAMATAWYILRTAQQWYDLPALIFITAGSGVGGILGGVLAVVYERLKTPWHSCTRLLSRT
ncbi:XK-related protein 6-like [Branchiostoma floridae x Branchiostoma belcheri]